MIIDTIGTSYDSMEELIERQHIIEDRVREYIADKGIADRYETTITMAENNKYYLTIQIIKD